MGVDIYRSMDFTEAHVVCSMTLRLRVDCSGGEVWADGEDR